MADLACFPAAQVLQPVLEVVGSEQEMLNAELMFLAEGRSLMDVQHE